MKSKFWKRLRFYLIGFTFGLILVFFIFKDRELPAWLPEGRVLEHFQRVDVTFSEKAECMLECLEMDKDELKALVPEADVDFGASDTREKPCPNYWIDLPPSKGKKLKIYIESCEKRATVEKIVHGRNEGCDC